MSERRGRCVAGRMPRPMTDSASQRQRGWLAIRNLHLDSLLELSARWAISPGQVVSVLESLNGTYTLFFEPTPEQRALHAREAEEAGAMARE